MSEETAARIASALERIASALESGAKPRKAPQPSVDVDDRPPGFERFRTSYPPNKRRRIRDALKCWKSRKLEDKADSILSALALYKRHCPEWTREGGRYIPDFATWLNEGMYNDTGFAGPASSAEESMADWKSILRLLIPDDPKLAEYLSGDYAWLPPELKASIARRNNNS